ncbi:MAG: NAD-dependent epimerase/dehydratase family protein [Actinomycetota bacterium]
MRVVVTGGAGFIGSHVVDSLLTAGCDVTVVDLLHPWAHAAEPAYVPPSAHFERVDLRDEHALRSIVANADAVSHQASVVGIEQSFADACEYVAHNALGTASLLATLHHTGFGGRLVLGSSMVVYGEGAHLCGEHGPVRPGPRTPRELAAGRFDPPCPKCGRALSPLAVSEDDPVDPRTIYAATKLHQEQLCALFGHEHGLPVCLLRYHNVYGPRMPSNTPYAGVASIFRSAIGSGRAPEVFEDGGQLRDFIHVTDVARANALVLSSEPAASGTFNIATGVPRSVGDLARALCSATRQRALVPSVSGRYRLGDIRHVCASPERARRVLGFSAKVPFEDGMRAFAYDPQRAA